MIKKALNLSSKTAENEQFPFMVKFDDRFKELFFLKFFNLPEIFAINQSFSLKLKTKKFCRFTRKKAVRFKNLIFFKIFKMLAQIDKNSEFTFLSKNADRFYFFIFFKKINLPGKIDQNRNIFFVLCFEKFLRFPSKIAGRLFFLRNLKFSNLPSIFGKNQKFLFFCFFRDRFVFSEKFKKNNLRYFFSKNQSFYFYFIPKKLFVFLLKKASRFENLKNSKLLNLRVRTVGNQLFQYVGIYT